MILIKLFFQLIKANIQMVNIFILSKNRLMTWLEIAIGKVVFNIFIIFFEKVIAYQLLFIIR